MNLKELLIIKNISQSSIARELGIKRQSVYLWCIGKNVPTFKQAYKLSKLLNISMEELIHIFYKEVIN